MLKEGDVYSLIVNDVYGEDADEYVCRAINKGGIKSTRAELIIMSKCLCSLLMFQVIVCVSPSGHSLPRQNIPGIQWDKGNHRVNCATPSDRVTMRLLAEQIGDYSNCILNIKKFA
jgi:hypothetical protein